MSLYGYGFLVCLFVLPGDVLELNAVADDADPEEEVHQPDVEALHATAYEYEEAKSDDEQELHPDMMPFMFVDTDSEDEGGDVPTALAEAKRVRCLESQPEYQRLKDANLASRPHGCTLGCHPSARVYRAWAAGSTHFSRSYGGKSNRTPWQALLRVMELMLEQHLDKHVDKLAKKQLVQIQHLRAAEPPHDD